MPFPPHLVSLVAVALLGAAALPAWAQPTPEPTPAPAAASPAAALPAAEKPVPAPAAVAPAATPAPAPATPTTSVSQASSLPLRDLLWRQVTRTSGEALGSISDVLVRMPSGEIAFVVIQTNHLFDRPRAIPPASLTVPDTSGAAAVFNPGNDDWINAPQLDWNAVQVVQRTESGEKILGYYHRDWLGLPPPEPPRRGAQPDPEAAPLPATQSDGRPIPTYVSIQRQLSKRVTTPAWDQDGFLNDFLVDWTAKRVTHALVSPQFPPLAAPTDLWFAIPVALLTPGLEHEPLAVNSPEETFARAPRLQGQTLRADQAGVYQFPGSSVTTVMSAAE